jgi:hypothetical protein
MAVRKKYNPQKHLQNSANLLLKNKAISYITGQPHCLFVDTKKAKLLDVSSTHVYLLSKIRHSWTVYISAFGFDEKKQPYTKSKEVYVSTPCFQADLVDYLNKEHAILCRSFNSNHFSGAGWLATPYHCNWEEKNAFNLFNMLGAFE